MTRKNFTPEEKQAYFERLRSQWQAAKEFAEHDEQVDQLVDAIVAQGVENVSPTNVMLVLMQAREQGLDGLPYIDFKDYRGWQKAGFQVRRGEKSRVFAITWVGGEDDRQNNDGDEEPGAKKVSRRWPKMVHLFHRSQVDPAAGRRQ